MSENRLLELPVVVVGKDRTRMTCAVIDHLKAHIKNAKPYFICVSDRSRPGHDKVIENHLRSIGEERFEVLRTLPEENRYGWGCAINLGLQCAFDQCLNASFALVVDNDWLLQRDLDIEKYDYAFAMSEVGAVTFKSVNPGTNVSLAERKLDDGSVFLLRDRGTAPRYSFTAEIGCMLITRRFRDRYGDFKENCVTDETEWAFCDWYNSLSPQERGDARLWFATDKELFHEELNGENHVFTHVGIVSQHDGPHKWDCPRRYIHLSDEIADAGVCRDAINPEGSPSQRMPCIIVGRDRTDSTMGVIDLLKCHLKGINPYFICVSDRSEDGHCGRIRNFLSERGYQGIILETKADRFGLGAAMNMGLEAGFKLSDKCLLFENDVFPMKDINVDWVSGLLDESECGAFLFKVPNGTWREGVSMEAKDYRGEEYLVCDCKDPQRENYAYEFGAQMITRRFYDAYGAFMENAIPPNVEWDAAYRFGKMPSERKRGDRIFAARARRFSLCLGEYNGEYFLHGDEATQKFMDNCDLSNPFTTSSVRDEIEEESVTIDWKKYFDRIYVFHYLPQTERYDRLCAELRRVGIYDSGIMEMRYTIPTRYNDVLLRAVCSSDRWANNTWVASLGMAQMSAFREALFQGYKRVLILENDVAFLKDKNTIVNILDNMPSDYDYIQMDKFLRPGFGDYETYVNSNRINDWYYAPKEFHTGADCVVLNEKAMIRFCEVFEQHITPSDLVVRDMGVRYACASSNICVQVNYDGSCNLKMGTIQYQDMCYKEQGIKYSDYLVPQGYDYGVVILQGNKSSVRHRKFISVYAIAKNEASVARRWYDCVKEADEVCVLDTGSTDETVEILRSLGAKVTVKTYDDWSFAVARNDSMSLVSPEADILFTLDLDETIAPGWRKKLEDAWVKREQSGVSPTGCVYKYIWSFHPDGTEAQSFSVRKIHAKGQGKWKYRCHELLTEVDDRRAFFLDDFVVEHHQNRATNRSQYLPLLEKDAKEMPDDDRSAYYYARELMYLGRWQESLDEFKRHLSLPSARWAAERASSMRNIASCYGQLGNKELCELWLRKSADEDPTNREATFRLGEIAMEEKDYPAAVAAFRRCLAIEKPSLEYISIPVVWSARPWFLYAQALWWTGDWKGAEEASRKALEIEPHNPEVRSQYVGMASTRKKFNR